MLFKIFLLLLPALSYCDIYIHIIATLPENNAHVEYLGANIDVIGDRDIEAFGLDRDSLIEAVYAYNGEKPVGAYVRDSTRDGEDLYAKNDWNEVKKIIVPVADKIINENVEKIELASEDIVNPKSEKLVHTIEHNFELENHIHGKWIKEKGLNQDTNAEYVIDFHVDGEATDNDNVKTFQFKSPFGKPIDYSQLLEISQKMEVLLQPDEQISVSMTVKKVNLEIDVKYNITLEGDIAVYYPDGFKGQNYWAFDVNEVLKADNRPTEIEWTQKLQLEYYVTPSIDVLESN